MSNPPMVVCPECVGIGVVTSDHPNDPGARIFTCDRCDGEGVITPRCEHPGCGLLATGEVNDLPYCKNHLLHYRDEEPDFAAELHKIILDTAAKLRAVSDGPIKTELRKGLRALIQAELFWKREVENDAV